MAYFNKDKDIWESILALKIHRPLRYHYFGIKTDTKQIIELIRKDTFSN